MAILTQQIITKTLTYSGTYGDAVPYCTVLSGTATDGSTISGNALVYNFDTSEIQREKVVQLKAILEEAYSIMV